MWFWQTRLIRVVQPEVDYSTAYDWIEQGQVKSVLLRGPLLKGDLESPKAVEGKQASRFQAVIPAGDDGLLPLLRVKRVSVRAAVEEQTPGVQIVMALLPWLLIGGVWIWIARRTQRTLSGNLGGLMKPKSRKFEKATAVNVTFADVAGLKAAKQDLSEIVQFLKEPERFRRLGGRIPRGVLLVGPPGTGKTLLARAVAGESGVPFFSISASEFIEMFVGVGAARVRDLFAEAKRSAPAIVFIDEIDAVGRSRGVGLGGAHDEREQTLNQLLSEMDGFNRNDLTIVLAATNRPDVLDPALLRPGRFDRRVIVDRPENAARQAILRVHTKGKPLAADVDIEQLASNTPGFSGADLANLVNEAALTATRRGALAISEPDFSDAFDKIVLGDPREAKLDPQEKRRVAVHEAGHALVARVCEGASALHRVSIIPRGMALGATQQTPQADRHLMTEPQLQARLAVLLAGHASERLVLGTLSSGAENDLREAMKIATHMVASYGMSSKLGPAYYEPQSEQHVLGQSPSLTTVSAATGELIESESRGLLAAALRRAEDVLNANRRLLDTLINELLLRETLERDALDPLFGSLETKSVASSVNGSKSSAALIA
jgi:cell division protease FtsH